MRPVFITRRAIFLEEHLRIMRLSWHERGREFLNSIMKLFPWHKLTELYYFYNFVHFANRHLSVVIH